MTKPREKVRPLIDAGFGPRVVHPGWAALGLPFDPHEYPIKTDVPDKVDLAGRLAGVGDVATLNLLQSFDTRNNAAAVYERRIDELNDPPKE